MIFTLLIWLHHVLRILNIPHSLHHIMYNVHLVLHAVAEVKFSMYVQKAIKCFSHLNWCHWSVSDPPREVSTLSHPPGLINHRDSWLIYWIVLNLLWNRTYNTYNIWHCMYSDQCSHQIWKVNTVHLIWATLLLLLVQSDVGANVYTSVPYTARRQASIHVQRKLLTQSETNVLHRD